MNTNHNAKEIVEQDQKTLLTLARKALKFYLHEHKIPTLLDLTIEVSDTCKQLRATFVTLKKKSLLRGCIGEIYPTRALYQSVMENTIRSAVKDTRFSPVTLEEYPHLTVDISILTVPQVVDSPDAIRTGIDGIILQKDGRSAVFLPQVAPEQGWNLEQTLMHLCMKAGLPGNAWQQNAEFMTFQATVFGED